jgi:hypothetical protein
MISSSKILQYNLSIFLNLNKYEISSKELNDALNLELENVLNIKEVMKTTILNIYKAITL